MRILLATDGSRHGERAAEEAGQIAKIFGLPVTVLSVQRPKFDQMRRAEALLEVDRVRKALAQEGIDANSAVVEGAEPADVIVNYARQHAADLIVMGSHGRTGLGRLLLGSVAEQVIGQAVCPVLVVKA